jgi:hypothetical protein
MGGLGSALLGNLADHTSITYVYNLCAFYLWLGSLLSFAEFKRNRTALQQFIFV